MANKDLWTKLYNQITTLQHFGITVAFWHVPRLRNQHADQLANDALIKELPAAYPYPKTLKRKREDDDGATSAGLEWVDTSTSSDPVWKHHHALAHLDLGIFKRTLRFYGHIDDIAEADVQAKIDSNERCQSCFARGAKTSSADQDQPEEPAAKRAKVEVLSPLAVAVTDASIPEAESTLDFARGFEFDFELPSGIVV